MLWPHRTQFPHRVPILGSLVVLGAGIPFAWPGLSLPDRLLTLVASFYGLAACFLFGGMWLMVIRVVKPLARILAYVAFYGSILSLVISIFQWAYALFAGERFDPFQAALAFAFTTMSSVGFICAGFAAINHPALSSNHRWSGP